MILIAYYTLWCQLWRTIYRGAPDGATATVESMFADANMNFFLMANLMEEAVEMSGLGVVNLSAEEVDTIRYGAPFPSEKFLFFPKPCN